MRTIEDLKINETATVKKLHGLLRSSISSQLQLL